MNCLSSRTLNRARMLEFLKGITNGFEDRYRSLYLVPGMPPTEIERTVKPLEIPAKAYDEAVETACHSKTGSAIFRGYESIYLVLPPFPVGETINSDTLNTTPLLSLLQTDYKIALILARLGSYAVGVCQGENLISSKVGTGLVHGRHKKGGSSAHRFERHRDKQIEYFLTRVCQRTREQLEPHLNSLDYLIYGGARTTIQLLQKQCPFVSKLEMDTLPPLFDIPEPRQAVLEKAVSRIWSSTVIEWVED